MQHLHLIKFKNLLVKWIFLLDFFHLFHFLLPFLSKRIIAVFFVLVVLALFSNETIQSSSCILQQRRKAKQRRMKARTARRMEVEKSIHC